jgi:hypothetical protein
VDEAAVTLQSETGEDGGKGMILSDMDAGPCLLDLTLPIELENRNDGQGHSFWRTDADKKRFNRILLSYKRKPFLIPVFMIVTRVLGKGQKLWDYDSGFRGSWKQLQDALVDAGWFYDDGPGHIGGIFFRQDDRDRAAGPSTRIQIWQYGTEPVRTKQAKPATGGRGKVGLVKSAQAKTRRSRRKKSKYK